MLSRLSAPIPDPILSLSTAYRSDVRGHKVDLGIGVYKNDHGETPIMTAVKEAQRRQAEVQTTKSYVGLAGCEAFNQSITELVLGGSEAIARSATIQTPGASGALRMVGDLIKVANPDSTVWISNPSYVNHAPVMRAAGLNVRYYRYLDEQTRQVSYNGMMQDLAQAKPNDIVLLHGCCHNPTGADLTVEQWKEIGELAQKHGLIPFVDFAYQGFGDGLEQDATGIQTLAACMNEMFVTYSCSKNFGLYRERTGAAIVIGKNADQANNAKGQILTLARASYTMPPDHGANLVTTVLQDAQLKQLWQSELVQMQQRLVSLRTALCEQLISVHDTDQFSFIQNHKGMFSMLGFSPEQMACLKEEYAIYGVGDSRINIAGLQEKDIEHVAKAIINVSRAYKIKL